ncbi:carboxyl transferase domain-containing protein [Aspergillus fruticulosus]
MALWYALWSRTSSLLGPTSGCFPAIATESVFPGPNKADWEDILARFEEALKRVSAEGNEVSLNRHQSRGQLLPASARSQVSRNPDSTLCSNLMAGIGNAGQFLPQQFRVFHKGWQLYRDLAVRTRRGKPSSYHPAQSDYTILGENQAQAFLVGPPLVKMATGEAIGAEELGGANVHATITGLADQIAFDEFDAIIKAREWVASLRERTVPVRGLLICLLSLVNTETRRPFDMLEVLLRIMDDSRFPVGIVANQISVINPNEAAKTAQFICTCNQEKTPIISLHNVTGFVVGAKAEHAGIIKMGAQLISAVSCSSVPHISIIMGASYGAGNYAMCGRAYKPRFIFTWPTGRCSVIQSAKSKRKVLEPEKLKKLVESFCQNAARDSECYATSSMLIEDGIPDPRDTRDLLGMCLEAMNLKCVKGTETHRLLARI